MNNVQREQYIVHWCLYPSTTPATPTLKELKIALKSVSDWYSLGIYLDLKSHQLKTIENNHRGDNERCGTEMLDCWLNNTATPTWEAIIKALDWMEQRGVADEIRRKCVISNTTIEGTDFPVHTLVIASGDLSNPVMLAWPLP